MLPALFLALDALPLTLTGKVDRQALPAPETRDLWTEPSFVAPRTAVEQTLATIWAQVLGVEPVGIHDNFFALGGDSILSIQIVARAKQAHLHMTPRQLFEYPTVALLARVVSTAARTEAEQGLVTGVVPLTPMQHWFLQQEQPESYHWNQAVLLSVAPQLEPTLLEHVVARLIEQHDALRLRFVQSDGSWQQTHAAPAEQLPLSILDLSELPQHEQGSEIEREADRAQASLDLSEGPLLRVVYFDLGTDQPGRLLIVIHHLAVDGVSWRILLEDLHTAYEQLEFGQVIQLPPKTTSFQQWARRINDYAHHETMQQELNYWLEQGRLPITRLPIDHEIGENTVASAQSVIVSLSVEETQALLHEVPQVYHTQINDVLLTALAQTFSHWTGERSHLIHLEGHGREDLFEDVDLSRTVGWLTSLFPLTLNLGEHAQSTQLGEQLKTIKEQLRQVPHRGIGYGLLRYLCSETAKALTSMPKAELSFNYLGQFDQAVPAAGLFGPAMESSGLPISPHGKREHLLDINGSISGGQLHFIWTYSQHFHRLETIEQLTSSYMQALRELIAHCQQPEVGGYTPSDFPLVSLSQRQLDTLLGSDRQVEAVYPLSPLQQGLLFHSLYAPEGGDYIIQVGCSLQGSIQVATLQQAWQQVMEQQSILRTAFVWEELDEPAQMVRRQVAVPWVQLDWRAYSTAEQQARLTAYLHEDRLQGFELSQAPLMRFTLIQLTDEKSEFIWSHHHLLLDGWSLPLVLNEVWNCYEALCGGQRVPLRTVRPYQDYIAWLQQQDLAQAERYWRAYLHGVNAPTALCIDHATTAERGYEEQVVPLSTLSTQELQQLAREQHVTLNTVLQAAWALLLSRYSGQDEVVYGTTVSGRPGDLEGVESMVGLFINTLPVRIHLAPGESVLSCLQTVQAQQTEMRQYEYSPLVQVQSWSEVPRGRPLFESLFIFENYPISRTNTQAARGGPGHLTLAATHIKEQTSYPLTLVVFPGAQVTLKVLYDRSRFEPASIQRLLTHLQTLLHGMLSQPTQPVASLPLLSAAELEQVRQASIATQVPYAQEPLIHQMVEQHAALTPEATALMQQGHPLSMSYATLNARANQLAHLLQRLGVGPDVVVGVCMQRSAEMLLGMLAVLKAGGAYLPLDSSYPPERLAFMLSDAQVGVLLTQHAVRDLLPSAFGTSTRTILYLDTEEDCFASEPESAPSSSVLPEHLAYVIYTSGSTGRPKGVQISHGSLLNLVAWHRHTYALTPQARTTQLASIAFDACVWEIWPTLAAGACLALPSDEVRLSPADLRDWLIAESITHSFVPTPLADSLLSLPWPKGEQVALRYLLTGGDKLQRYPEADLPFQLINHYGPTESTVVATAGRIEARGQGTQLQRAPSIGRAINNTQVYVLDAHLQPMAEGVIGELCLGSVGLARGYLGRAELTAEKFIAHPCSSEPGARLYRTGDLVRMGDDGQLEFVGRRDEQVKLRGYRIELGEIESVLAQQPGVQESVVQAREDTVGHQQLVGYVVAGQQEKVTSNALRTALLQQLPDYMVPAAFVLLEALPLTPNGKVDRRALPAPDYADLSTEQEFVEARTPVEQTLATIWAQVLGVEPVGIHDNFFNLGGDSILSIQIVARANQHDLHITPRQLFQHPTIAELAAIVSFANTQTKVEAEQGVVFGDVPLTPIQHWFFEQEQPQRHHWNQAVLLKTKDRLDPGELEAALVAMLTHHDALRLRFAMVADSWQQMNAPVEADSPFAVVDLSALASNEQKAEIEAIAAEKQASLNLEEGPLVRMVYFDLGTDQPGRLLIVIHHLAVDGVSWRILLEDLHTAYEQLKCGRSIKLPAKTTSFQQWARWLTEYAQSEELREELPYWQGLADKTFARLPIDHKAGENTVASAHSVFISLTVEETQALLHEVPQVYHTQINDVLLTALAQTLTRWTEEWSHLIHLEGHGREDLFKGVDVSRTVGWFTSLYPINLHLDEYCNSAAQALKTVKEQLRAIPLHGIGFGLLRYLYNNKEDVQALRTLPEVEIGFNYLGQFDQKSRNEPGNFENASETPGPLVSPYGKREHLLDINGSISEGQLFLHWTYSENIHRHETIENLALSYVQALRELIAHCQQPEVGGYTPSDFPLVSLSQRQLDTLLGSDRQVEAVYPLSPLQQGLLFHSLYAPEGGDYVVQMGYTLQGRLNVEALRQAWQQVMEHHSILRTTFLWEEVDQPIQVVRRQVAVPWVQLDWRAYSAAEQQARLTAYLHEDRMHGFRLGQAPLMRLALVQLTADASELIWSHHHLLLDGWSLPLVLNEVFACYDALCEGKRTHLTSVRPYQDYIAWLQQQDLEQAERYWRERLGGLNSPTPLGIDHPSMGERGYEEQVQFLSTPTTQALQQLAREQHITLNTVLQAAWALLLSRYSGQDDVLFGTTVSGRPADIEGVEAMVGLFINTLPVRVKISPETTLSSWLQELQEQQTEMRQYEYSSLSQVQSWSDIERGLPFFESLFVFENYPVNHNTAQEDKDLSIRAAHTKEQTSYPLTLACIPGSHLLLKLLYDRSRFQQADISRLQGHLLTLLENMLAQPTQPLATLCLLAAPEQQALLTCNATHTDYPHTACIHTLVEAQVARTPDAIAVSYQQQSLTYRQLNARANQLAHALHALGVAPNQCVGVYAERSLHMIVSFLAILKVGAAYLPLDLSYPQDRISFMLQDAQATVLLTQHHLASGLTNPAHHVICLDTQWSSIAQHPQDNLPNRIDAHHLAYVIYTSGSTGRPKGVCISHQAIARLLCNTNYIHLTPSDVVAQASNASFDAATFEIWGALLHGAHLVGISKEIVLTPQALAACLRDLQVTTLFLTTALFNQIAQSVPQAFQSLRHLLFGGEAVDPGCVRTVLQQGAPARLLHVYGPTESTTFATWKRIEQVAPEATTLPIGSPLANTQTYLLDQHRCPVPTGVPGELYIGGDGLAQGYLRRPELTAETFVPHPWSPVPGARLYRTGDLGRMLADGSIEFLGRLDQQVKMRGLRIELGEIEGVLAQQPAVRECAVVARQDPAGNKRLVAYVVWTPGQAIAVAALRDLLHDSLPDYMVPSTFMMLESLPLTPNGKVDRRALPAPDYTQLSWEKTYVAPRTEVEQKLAEIWQEVLGIEQVGVHDNFFELGGHSLLATQVISRIRTALQVEIPLQSLFEAPTVAELVVAIVEKQTEQVDNDILAQALEELERLSEEEV